MASLTGGVNATDISTFPGTIPTRRTSVRTGPGELQRLERFLHPGVVRRDARPRSVLQDLLLDVGPEGSRGAVGPDRVDEDHRGGAGEERCQVETRRAEIEDDDAVRKREPPEELLDDPRPGAVVSHQDVPEADDADGHSLEVARRTAGRLLRGGAPLLLSRFRHPGQSARTFAISFPSTSRVWMAQAMQGSKEWIVRMISSGFSASATGFPMSEAS